MIHIRKPSMTDKQKQKIKVLLFIGIAIMGILVVYNTVQIVG